MALTTAADLSAFNIGDRQIERALLKMVADIQSLSTSTTTPSTFLQNAFTRGRVTNTLNSGITSGFGSSLMVNRSGAALTSVRGLFYNGIINSNSGLSEKPNNVPTYIRMSIQYPAYVGTPVSILWNGNALGMIPGGTSLAAVGESDDTPLPFAIPDGAVARVSVYTQCAAGLMYSDMGASMLATDVCVTAPSRDYTLDVNPPASNATNVAIYPWGICSSQCKRASAYTCGDSIDAGYVDNSVNSPLGDVGLMARRFGKFAPYINGGCTGEYLRDFLLSNAARLYVANKYNNVVTLKLGTNDKLNAIADATIIANLQTAWGLFPGKRLGKVTLPPLSSSTDGAVTEANQTQGFDVNTNINAAIRNSGGFIFDAYRALASNVKAGVWKAPNDTKPIGDVLGVMTVDLIHPSYIGHQYIDDHGLLNAMAMYV